MTEVLLVSPIVNDNMRCPSYSLGLLSAILRNNGVSTKIFIFENNFDSFQAIIENENPSIICYSSVTINYKKTVGLNRFAKSISNSIVSIIGGHHVTACPEEAVRDGFDYVVKNIGETAIIKVVKSILKGDKCPQVYSEQSLFEPDDLPFIDLDIFGGGEYVWRPIGMNGPEFGMIMTSFGCVSNCSYCDGHNYWPTWRAMSADRAIREIEHQLEALGLNRISITDSIVAPSVSSFERFVKIVETLDRRGIEYIASFKPSLISKVAASNPGLLDRACENLVAAPLSADSGSLRLLQEYNNKILPDDIITAAREFEKRGVFTILHFVIGGLNETYDTIEETRRLFHESGANLALASLLTPHPGTLLFNHLHEEGKILTYNWDHYDQRHLVFEHPSFEPLELETILQEANLEFKKPLLSVGS